MKQVPGNGARLVSKLPYGAEVPEQPIEVQAEVLQELLAGHEIFAKLRGKLNNISNYSLLQLGSDRSPSAVLEEFDTTVSNLRVMCNYLALLRWHGCRRAAAELVYAFTHDNFVMWCESVPFDQTTPCTILMFEPEMMIRLARWWSQESNVDGQLWGQYDTGGLSEHPALSEETRYWVDRFPILRIRPSRNGTPYTLFMQIWLDIEDMFRSNLDLLSQQFAEDKMTPRGPTFPIRAGDMNGADMGAFAYLFIGSDQARVLSWISRDRQRFVATWQMNIPNVYLSEPEISLSVGFYPEAEHGLWSRLNPSLVSRGFSQGLGVLINPREEFCQPSLDGRLYMQTC